MSEYTLEAAGRNIRYRYTPAADETAPLLVIFHGHARNPRASKFRHANWNVLCPIDDFGVDQAGSWFLGEGGDFFWLDAMPQLISNVYEGKEVYFCGSSMGGYAAILHGTLQNATAVYANIAQTWLLGSTYSERGMKRFFSPIFGNIIDDRYNDLTNIIDPGQDTSYILSGIRWDKPDYIQQQTLRFASHLANANVNFSLEVRFGSGHGLTHSISEIAEIFTQSRSALRIPQHLKEG